MNTVVFPGTASTKLAQKVARLAGLELGKHEIVTFANSEIKVTIQSEVAGREAIVLQSTANPTNRNLVELLFTVDALRRGGASQITAIVPYFGYARQNMQHRPGECVSLNVIVKILETLSVDRVVTVDLHDEGSSSVFSIPFENKSALPLLAKEIYRDLGLTHQSENNYLVGSPDQGGIERARTFANHFYTQANHPETITVEKKRNLDLVHESKAVEIFGDVKGKHLILVDDVSTSGKTIVNAAVMCLHQGAKSVFAAVVHPDFGLGVPKYLESSPLTQFYCTNTIETTLEDLALYPKIKQIEVAPLFLKNQTSHS